MVHRRDVLTGLGASLALAASPTGARAASTKIRMGTLRLIHCITPYFCQQFAPSGLTIEVLPFESPTDCKNAVTTKSVDFGTFGIAAAAELSFAWQAIAPRFVAMGFVLLCRKSAARHDARAGAHGRAELPWAPAGASARTFSAAELADR